MNVLTKAWEQFQEKRLTRLILPSTLVSPVRVQNLYRLVRRIDSEEIPGDVVECGVYKGGTAAVLARVATRSKQRRRVWLFDSFQGMPEVTEADGHAAREWVGKLSASPGDVRTLLARVGADLSRVTIVPGFFQETFSTVRVRQIALLNLDCDWFDSVKMCLDNFYDYVVPGGFVSLDDYGHWEGCRKAVDLFFLERGLSYQLREVDYSGRWFQKL